MIRFLQEERCLLNKNKRYVSKNGHAKITSHCWARYAKKERWRKGCNMASIVGMIQEMNSLYKRKTTHQDRDTEYSLGGEVKTNNNQNKMFYLLEKMCAYAQKLGENKHFFLFRPQQQR